MAESTVEVGKALAAFDYGSDSEEEEVVEGGGVEVGAAEDKIYKMAAKAAEGVGKGKPGEVVKGGEKENGGHLEGTRENRKPVQFALPKVAGDQKNEGVVERGEKALEALRPVRIRAPASACPYTHSLTHTNTRSGHHPVLAFFPDVCLRVCVLCANAHMPTLSHALVPQCARGTAYMDVCLCVCARGGVRGLCSCLWLCCACACVWINRFMSVISHACVRASTFIFISRIWYSYRISRSRTLTLTIFSRS